MAIPNPAGAMRHRAKKGLGAVLNAASLPGVQYTDPAGDPGWFGPDSALWYVHSHHSVVPGAISGLLMEVLHPDFTAAAQGSLASYEPLKRLGRSVSFVQGTTFGSTEVAEHLVAMVRGMHTRVVGVRADGQPFAASNPDNLRFGGATLAYGSLRAHQRYHPRPLRGVDADRYLADWAVVSEALGATDVPKTVTEMRAYFETVVPVLAVTELTIDQIEFFLAPPGTPTAARPVVGLLTWGVADLLPAWARRLIRLPDTSRLEKVAKRAALRAALNGLQAVVGPSPVATQAHRRTASVDDVTPALAS